LILFKKLERFKLKKKLNKKIYCKLS